MRATDLLGCRVLDGDGTDLGAVTGLRCTSDGPKKRGHLPAPRLVGLVVAPRGVGAALGYQQADQRGPWLLRVIITRLQRNARVVDWADVADHGDGVVRLRSRAGED
jgi:hypothetical protein